MLPVRHKQVVGLKVIDNLVSGGALLSVCVLKQVSPIEKHSLVVEAGYGDARERSVDAVPQRLETFIALLEMISVNRKNAMSGKNFPRNKPIASRSYCRVRFSSKTSLRSPCSPRIKTCVITANGHFDEYVS